MDAATLVVVFLLLTLASLASYLLSQWSFIRNSNISIIGWVAISIGTTLLLITAAVVMLTVGLLPKLPLLPSLESAEQRHKPTQLAERVLDRQEAPTDSGAVTNRFEAPTDRDVNRFAGRSIGEDRSENAAASTPGSPQPYGTSRAAAKSGAVSSARGLVFTEVDPWAATHCVYSFNPNPADLTQWRIENECGVPVAVLFASCPDESLDCGRASASWKYQVDGMILPARWQRAVTSAEETQYGAQIRYVACVLASPITTELIGQSREIRSTPSWLEEFDAARQDDECLMRVQRLSEVGRASGQSIDVLLGVTAPGNVRTGATSEL